MLALSISTIILLGRRQEERDMASCTKADRHSTNDMG